MSSYLVGVLGAAIGGGFATVFDISSPYRYFLIIGNSVLFYSLAEKYNKNKAG
jgi:hypothetical protein